MRKVFLIVLAINLFTIACTSATETIETQNAPISTFTDVPLASTSTPEPDSVIATATETAAVTATTVPGDDFFTQNGITLSAPVCNALTQSQTEGPYYTPNTPEKHSFLEEGMIGTRLLLVGYVLDQNCQPLPNTWLDFWQADANGEYDNVGYRLRGHQFTDAQGRYYLETVLPGLYSSRPIEHIHVKVWPEGGAEITSQVYFPQRPIEGLTATIEDRGDHLVGYFNFVVQK